MQKKTDRVILHCDMNNFYASVEQKLHPEVAGKPIAVCGDPKARHGIVLAKNIPAKQAGVKTGDTVREAEQKCPGIVFFTPHFDEYVKISKAVFELYTTYTDRVEKFGIDECWLDVTESVKLFGDGKRIADELRQKVKERFQLTISVGVSFTKTLAKLGSDLKKPDATTVLDREHYMDIIGDMSPDEFIMIGRSTSKKLKDLNITTIRQLAAADKKMLKEHFGVIGENIVEYARGENADEVKLYYEMRVPKSLSNGTTTPHDMTSENEVKTVVYALCELIAVRLRGYNLASEGVYLSIRTPELISYSKQAPTGFATSNASDLAKAALSLLKTMHAFPAPLRAVTVGAIRLLDKSETQISLFDEGKEKEEKLEGAIDDIRSKFGYNSVKRGILLTSTELVQGLHEEDGFKPFDRQ